MFLSSDKNVTKKKFQKPNILRRKPKRPTRNENVHESFESFGKSQVIATLTQEPKQQQDETKVKYVSSSPKKQSPRIMFEQTSNAIEATDVFRIVTNDNIDSIAVSESMITNNNEESFTQYPVNVESFLNDTNTVAQSDIDLEINSMKQDWTLDFMRNTHEIVIEDFDGSHLGSLHVQQNLECMEPTPAVVSNNDKPQEIIAYEPNVTDTPVQIITEDYFASSVMKFKCDVPDCKKRFRTEKSLCKHKTKHNPESTKKVVRQTIVVCPVGKGGIEPCGMHFPTRPDLTKHLKEHHDQEEATFVCSVCSKRFFWATELRLHSRAHGPRCVLACAWPGCGRVFRQPCRLREHQRAHNGDKPYPCRFQGCSWSFRSASKLARHERWHTGERRHSCGSCDRAFPRREHLRDHIARHHTPGEVLNCLLQGCKRTFPNMEMRSNHMRRVHKIHNATVPIEETPPVLDLDPKETYMLYLNSGVSERPEVSSEGAGLAPAAGAASPRDAEWEGHAARTHCTWPLAPRTTADVSFVEEDVQVELSEGSESNTYTIRSDLFLHGNVLNNEDSVHMVGDSGAVATDAGLSLLDVHPTIDLMQEDLMYTDAAVDESTFRVFLLSGEELA